jgi:hypothetical protein
VHAALFQALQQLHEEQGGGRGVAQGGVAVGQGNLVALAEAVEASFVALVQGVVGEMGVGAAEELGGVVVLVSKGEAELLLAGSGEDFVVEADVMSDEYLAPDEEQELVQGLLDGFGPGCPVRRNFVDGDGLVVEMGLLHLNFEDAADFQG